MSILKVTRFAIATTAASSAFFLACTQTSRADGGNVWPKFAPNAEAAPRSTEPRPRHEPPASELDTDDGAAGRAFLSHFFGGVFSQENWSSDDDSDPSQSDAPDDGSYHGDYADWGQDFPDTLSGTGTGFYIAPRHLMTAAHVIEECAWVTTATGVPLEVIAADHQLDLAVLSNAPRHATWLKFAPENRPLLGESVSVLGYPFLTQLGQGLTLTTGNVSALRGIEGDENAVMISAPVQPGNSGGPMLNRQGAVIGVVVAQADDDYIKQETGSIPQNMNFAVPVGTIMGFLHEHALDLVSVDSDHLTQPEALGASHTSAVIALYCHE